MSDQVLLVLRFLKLGLFDLSAKFELDFDLEWLGAQLLLQMGV